VFAPTASITARTECHLMANRLPHARHHTALVGKQKLAEAGVWNFQLAPEASARCRADRVLRLAGHSSPTVHMYGIGTAVYSAGRT
jgi:hypothetical protein